MLALLTGWRGYALILAVGLGLGWAVQGWRWGADVAGMKRDQAVQLADAVQLARQTEQARWANREKVLNDAKAHVADLEVQLGASHGDLDRLRGELAAASRRARSAAARAGSKGQPGDDPIGVLAELYGRLAERDQAVGEYADRLRIAGLACERSYDSLVTK